MLVVIKYTSITTCSNYVSLDKLQHIRELLSNRTLHHQSTAEGKTVISTPTCISNASFQH